MAAAPTSTFSVLEFASAASSLGQGRLCVKNRGARASIGGGGRNATSMQPFLSRLVRYWSKETNGTLTGGRKRIFLIRDIDDATRAGASVESCRFVVPEVSWSRLGSVLVACKRLRRTRGRSHRWIHISTGPQHCADNYHDPPKFWIQSSLESTKNRRMRSRRLPDPRPIPEGAREPICIHKK